MAEDLSKFINSMGGIMERGRSAVTATDDPVRKVKNTQVAESVKAQSAIALSDLVSIGEVQQLQQQKKAAQDATITQIEDTQMKYQRITQERIAQADQEAANSKKLRQSLNESYDTALQDYAQEVQGANFSFFRNPLTYIRDQYRVGYKTERLRELAQAIDGTTSRIRGTYMQAAEDLQRLRTGSMATELMAITQKHRRDVAVIDDDIMLAQQKLQVNEFIRNKTTDILNTTLQLQSDPRGAEGAQNDAMNLQIAKLAYIQASPTGTLEGFDPDNMEQVQALVASVKGRGAEYQARFFQQLPYFTVMDTTGNTQDIMKLMQFSAANKDLGTFHYLASESNHPNARPLKEMLDGTSQQLINQEYQSLEAGYLESLEKTNPEQAAQIKVSGIDKGTRQQLMEQATNTVMYTRGHEVMQSFLDGVGAGVAAKARANPAMLYDFAPAEAASLVIQDLPATFPQESARRVEAAFNSESFQNIKYAAAKLQSQRDQQNGLPLLGKTGAYVQATLDALRAEGIPEAEIPVVMSAYLKRAILANMMDEPGIGRQVKALAEFGLDDDVPMDVTVLESDTVFFGMIDMYGGKQFDAIRNQKANITTPEGASNAIAALDRFGAMRKAGVTMPVGAGIASVILTNSDVDVDGTGSQFRRQQPRPQTEVRKATLNMRYRALAKKIESGQYETDAERAQLVNEMQAVQAEFDALKSK